MEALDEVRRVEQSLRPLIVEVGNNVAADIEQAYGESGVQPNPSLHSMLLHIAVGGLDVLAPMKEKELVRMQQLRLSGTEALQKSICAAWSRKQGVERAIAEDETGACASLLAPLLEAYDTATEQLEHALQTRTDLDASIYLSYELNKAYFAGEEQPADAFMASITSAKETGDLSELETMDIQDEFLVLNKRLILFPSMVQEQKMDAQAAERALRQIKGEFTELEEHYCIDGLLNDAGNPVVDVFREAVERCEVACDHFAEAYPQLAASAAQAKG